MNKKNNKSRINTSNFQKLGKMLYFTKFLLKFDLRFNKNYNF